MDTDEYILTKGGRCFVGVASSDFILSFRPDHAIVIKLNRRTNFLVA